MALSFWVGNDRFEIGTQSFLKSFFSTIYVRLEGRRWGSEYPTIMRELYGGELRRGNVATALRELDAVALGLREHPPEEVVWDFEKPGAKPPWGDRVSRHITSLANYFVTSDGKDLIEVLGHALKKAEIDGQDVRVL